MTLRPLGEVFPKGKITPPRDRKMSEGGHSLPWEMNQAGGFSIPLLGCIELEVIEEYIHSAFNGAACY